MSGCRRNESLKGRVDRNKVIGEGSFKRVYSGVYVEGRREGQPQATKELIHRTPHTSTVFYYDVIVAKVAAEIVEAWNVSNFINKHVVVTIPEIWVYTSKSDVAGVTHLVEPFIKNFEKFNSNTGWVPSEQRRWSQVMQVRGSRPLHCSS